VSIFAGAPGQRIAVISASFGAGHDSAARALAREFSQAGYTVTCYDFLDLLWGPLGRTLRETYSRQIKTAPGSWGWFFTQMTRHGWLTSGVSGLSSRASVRRLRAVLGTEPVAVVSTYPLASQVLGMMRRDGELAAPVFTFFTEMSVHPIWVAAGVDLHLAVHEVTAAEARAMGAERVEVIRPAVDPAFAQPATAAERAATRARYGLPVDGPIALVVSGSWGVGEVAQTTADIAATGLATAVALCGCNETLQRRVAAEGKGIALGWVSEMPALVRAADVVVQNSSGITSLEAMSAGIPVLSYRSLPGHGTTNSAAMHRAGLAPWVTSPTELGAALHWALTYGATPAATRLFDGPAAIDAVRAVLATTGPSVLETRPAPTPAKPDRSVIRRVYR
jgi:UDP-N-acetylglucosamine:LPS N-acetylglucosamine transferase